MSKQLHKISKLIKRGINYIYALIKTKPLKVFTASDFETPKMLDIFVVAFNDAKLIETQYQFMQKNLQQNQYHYIICDNSNNLEIADKIFEFCQTHNITYYRLPQFLYVGPSHSHGYALNWIYKNLIKKRKNNFAFIDHDIFPIKPIDLSKYLVKPLSGVKRVWHGYWYPWVAFSFYSFDFMKTKTVNFLPCRYKHKHLDTGGKNYKSIYKNIDSDLWLNLPEKKIDVITGKDFTAHNLSNKEADKIIYNQIVEIIDDKWLHIIGGAQWGGKHNKFALAMKKFGDYND